MKKYYFISEIRGIVGEHSGNIRGAKTKAQKFAEQFDEEITILVRSNKEIDCGKNIPANEEVCRVCNADGDVLAVCSTHGNAFAWCAENGIEGEIGEYEPYIEVGTYSENGNFEVEDYSSIDTGDGMWNIINDYCDYVDTVCPEATAETVESVEVAEEATVPEAEQTTETVKKTESKINMKYITSAVTGERKETITIATEKRLQDLMKREHQSNEAKFLTWALKEYKCIKGCGSASIKEIRKYASQEDWLRNDFGFDTDGYMIETSSAMNIRFSDYMSYWCRFCYSSLNIKDFNGLVKAIYDMTDEYGYINYPEEVVESAEETTAPEAEQTAETVEQETELNTEVETEQTENNAESVSETYGGEDVKADTSKTDELSGTPKMIMVFSPVSEYLRQRGYIDTS